jgi:hypothetical protein
MYEETTGTLLCGDLFTAIGDGPAITDHEIVGPALRAEDIFGAICLMPSTAPAMRTLAALAPVSLGLMHGPAYTGDCAQALFDLADACEQRLEAKGVRVTAPGTPAAFDGSGEDPVPRLRAERCAWPCPFSPHRASWKRSSARRSRAGVTT